LGGGGRVRGNGVARLGWAALAGWSSSPAARCRSPDGCTCYCTTFPPRRAWT